MCEPISILAAIGGMAAAKAMAPKAPSAAATAQPEPANERANAEATAANTANMTAADAKRTRRANVLATGGSTDALGADQSAALPGSGKTSVLGGGAS